MSLFVLSDPHLSFSTDKPMDIFGERWNRHYKKIEENWIKLVSESDTVVLPGDISWGIDLADAREDLAFIDSLPGRKIIGRGNHDYWWTTAAKMNRFTAENGFSSLSFLYNNAFLCGDIAVCGTRGWMYEFGVKAEDARIIAREAVRLKLSLDAAVKLAEGIPNAELVAFTHYPVMFADFKNDAAIELLLEYGVRRIYCGHIHGLPPSAVPAEVYGMTQTLTSCDALEFCPIRVSV